MGIFSSICDEYSYCLFSHSIDKLKELSKSGRIVLYGSARIGRSTYLKLKENDIPVSAFCDDNPALKKKNFDNIDIITLEEFSNYNWLNVTIIICCIPSKSTVRNMYKKCVSKGFKKIYYIWDFHIYYDDKSELDLYEKDIDTLNDLLEDNKSKYIFQNVLRTRFSGDYCTNIFSDTADENQYFATDILKFSESEVFIDGGSYHGETIDTFLKISNGMFNKIYAFEANDTNFNILEQNISHSLSFSRGGGDLLSQSCFK